MRVNIYAEEMPDEPRLEIIEKEIEGHKFTALRIYLELPATDVSQRGECPDCLGSGYRADDYCRTCAGEKTIPRQVQGPFIHRPGDDDSAAVTFWGKRDLRVTLRKALAMLDEHYAKRDGRGGDPLRNNPVVGFMSEKQAESILQEMREERRGDRAAANEAARRAIDDEAVLEERQTIADKAREFAGHYAPHSDGRNTFILLAEWIEARSQEGK